MKKSFIKNMPFYENSAVAACMVASTLVAVYADQAPFYVVFSLFFVSSLVLVVTTYIKKQWPHLRLQAFFLAINSVALVKLFLDI